MSDKRSLKNVTTLPEIVVAPAPWQIDYKKNFGNKNIRDKILKTMYNLKKTSISEEYNKILTDLNYNEENNKLKANNIVNEMLKKLNNIKEDDDYTLEIKRLYDVWNEAGRPTISNDKSIINYIPNNEYRPNYNNILNKIYKVNNTNDVVSELAHPIQIKNL